MSIWVGRYSIVDGAVREHGPWFVERLRTREDESVRLLVLAEPADERSAEFCAEVAEAVAELFARESLSVTGGLLRALRQAHNNLAEWNRRSLREHRVAMGITCVVLREGELTVAQAGPGVVYITGPEGLRRFATEEESDAAHPIGGGEPIDPQFTSMRLESRLVLLLTSVVERTIGSAPIAHALEQGAERALADLFLRTREIRDMTAVLVAEIDVPDGVPVTTTPPNEDDPPPIPRARPWRDPLGASQPPVPTVDSGAEFIAQRRGIGLPTLRRERAPLGGSTSAPGMLGRVGVRRGLRETSGAGGRQWRAPVLAAVALVVVAALVWFTVPGLIRQDNGARLEDALAVAQAHISAAAQTPDVTRSRSELQAAGTEIARARAMQPNDPRVAALQSQVDSAAQALDAVSDLGDGLKRVQAFEGVVTAPFNPAAMIAGDGALWMVDSERGRLFRIDLIGGTAPAEVYRSGTAYGGTTARDPRVVTWDAGGQRILLVDATPTLFSIVPGKEPVPIALRGAVSLKSIAAIATYSGNLYVLDPQGGEIWRYLPGGNGFDSERTGILGGVDLNDARGLAVDGDFFVLGAAAVRHFRPPTELPPLLQGIDRPISSPAGVALDPQHKLFYVGDRGGRRLVVSDRDGVYKRQYRAPQFFDARAIALAPDGATVYVLTGAGILAFTPTP